MQQRLRRRVDFFAGLACRDAQADDGIIAECSDGFQAHVTGALDGPCISPGVGF